MCGQWLILMINRVEMVIIIHLRIVMRWKLDKYKEQNSFRDCCGVYTILLMALCRIFDYEQ
jgi:hypothetical protein